MKFVYQCFDDNLWNNVYTLVLSYFTFGETKCQMPTFTISNFIELLFAFKHLKVAFIMPKLVSKMPKEVFKLQNWCLNTKKGVKLLWNGPLGGSELSAANQKTNFDEQIKMR